MARLDALSSISSYVSETPIICPHVFVAFKTPQRPLGVNVRRDHD